MIDINDRNVIYLKEYIKLCSYVYPLLLYVHTFYTNFYISFSVKLQNLSVIIYNTFNIIILK